VCSNISTRGLEGREKKGWEGNVADKRDKLDQDKVVARQQLDT
jgi:hypothetical protein